MSRADFVLLFDSVCANGEHCDNLASQDSPKPKHAVCDGACLRSSQNCRLELALLSVVECPVIVVHSTDDITRTVELAKQVFNRGREPRSAQKQNSKPIGRERGRSSACHTEYENFNVRLANAISNAKITHRDLDLATVLHQAYFDMRAAIIEDVDDEPPMVALPGRMSTIGDVLARTSRVMSGRPSGIRSKKGLSRGSSAKTGFSRASSTKRGFSRGNSAKNGLGRSSRPAKANTSSVQLHTNPMMANKRIGQLDLVGSRTKQADL